MGHQDWQLPEDVASSLYRRLEAASMVRIAFQMASLFS
jgi:hypothetical protein